MKIIATDAVIESEGRILLVKRKNEPFKDLWALPGGRIDENEKVEEAVVREVKEETGLEVKPLEILGVYSGDNIDPRGWAITTVFISEKISGELVHGSDASDADWFAVENLPKIGFPHHRKIISDFISWKTKKGTYWMDN